MKLSVSAIIVIIVNASIYKLTQTNQALKLFFPNSVKVGHFLVLNWDHKLKKKRPPAKNQNFLELSAQECWLIKLNCWTLSQTGKAFYFFIFWQKFTSSFCWCYWKGIPVLFPASINIILESLSHQFVVHRL